MEHFSVAPHFRQAERIKIWRYSQKLIHDGNRDVLVCPTQNVACISSATFKHSELLAWSISPQFMQVLSVSDSRMYSGGGWFFSSLSLAAP